MNNNIFDMLNDSEIDLDNYEREELTDLEKGKIKRLFKKNLKGKNNKLAKMAKVVSITAILGAGAMVTPLGQQALASIDLVTYELGYLMGIEKDLDDYKTVVGKSVTDKGITIKVNEVILDGNQLRVSTTRHIEDDENTYLNLMGNSVIYINGKKVSTVAGGSSREIDKNTFVSDEDYIIEDIEKIDLTKELDIKIRHNSIFATPFQEGVEEYQSKIRRGNWEFDFKISPQQLIKDTETISINNKIGINDSEYVDIKEYTQNDLGKKIYIQFSKGLVGKYSAMIIGVDNLGNKIEFDTNYNGKDGGLLEANRRGSGVSEEATELKLQLQLTKLPDSSGEFKGEYINYGEEFTIKLK